MFKSVMVFLKINYIYSGTETSESEKKAVRTAVHPSPRPGAAQKIAGHYNLLTMGRRNMY
jgi:hypothetical protein